MASTVCVLCVLCAAGGSPEPPPAALCKIPYANATRAPGAVFACGYGGWCWQTLIAKAKAGSSFWAFPHPALQAEIRGIICLRERNSRSSRGNKWCLLISTVFG